MIARPTHVTHPSNLVFIHELGHEACACLDDSMAKEFDRFCWSSMSLGAYADQNFQEYFAMMTQAHFGSTCGGKSIAFKPSGEVVSGMDQKLTAFLSRVYGPPRKIAPP